MKFIPHNHAKPRSPLNTFFCLRNREKHHINTKNTNRGNIPYISVTIMTPLSRYSDANLVFIFVCVWLTHQILAESSNNNPKYTGKKKHIQAIRAEKSRKQICTVFVRTRNERSCDMNPEKVCVCVNGIRKYRFV